MVFSYPYPKLIKGIVKDFLVFSRQHRDERRDDSGYRSLLFEASGPAFVWLEEAYQERVSQLSLLGLFPRFDNLHSDPRFVNLLLRMNLMP